MLLRPRDSNLLGGYSSFSVCSLDMKVSSRVLKAHLWAAWAVTGGATVIPPAVAPPLRPYLEAQAASASAMLAGGQVKSNSANGHTTEFGGGYIDAAQVVQIWVYLADLFDAATAELKAGTSDANGNSVAPIASPTDSQVKSQMELNLRPVLGTTDNYMWLVKCILLLLVPASLVGCQAIIDRQNAKWNAEYSWINWPTNR